MRVSLLPSFIYTCIVETSHTIHSLACSRRATHFALSPKRLGTLYSLVLLVLRQLSIRSYSSGAVAGYSVVNVQFCVIYENLEIKEFIQN
jgi:hypothetical protein